MKGAYSGKWEYVAVSKRLVVVHNCNIVREYSTMSRFRQPTLSTNSFAVKSSQKFTVTWKSPGNRLRAATVLLHWDEQII